MRRTSTRAIMASKRSETIKLGVQIYEPDWSDRVHLSDTRSYHAVPDDIGLDIVILFKPAARCTPTVCLVAQSGALHTNAARD